MQGCSRMALDRRIPTMAGQSTSGFHRPGRGGGGRGGGEATHLLLGLVI